MAKPKPKPQAADAKIAKALEESTARTMAVLFGYSSGARAKKKLASGTTARSVAEWVGKTPDSRPPPSVQLRIWERQKGVCPLAGRKIRSGEKRELEHIKALKDGGENREGNLVFVLAAPHKDKTKTEKAVRKKVQASAKADAGIRPEQKRPLESRNDLAKPKPKSDRLPMPSGPTALMRRGFVPAR